MSNYHIMTMSRAIEENLADVADLLTRASRAMGLYLCYHDRLGQTGRLSQRWKTHVSACCRKIKKSRQADCVAFDAGEVHRALAGMPEGRIHTCPFGVTELAVPVMSDGLFAGVLFAGPCRRGRGRAPHPGMIRVSNPDWLRDRLVLLRGVAAEMSRFLSQTTKGVEHDRRGQVGAYLRDHMKEPIYLPDLARSLALSASRARHVIRELFGVTFSALVRSTKLREAAYHLRTSDLPVGQVADRVGYPDQNYFTRVFSRHFRVSPRVYRRRYSIAP